MKAQVEADVTTLMVGQVPSAFKDLAITIMKAAHPKFWEEMRGFSPKKLMERTFRDNICMSCVNDSTT